MQRNFRKGNLSTVCAVLFCLFFPTLTFQSYPYTFIQLFLLFKKGRFIKSFSSGIRRRRTLNSLKIVRQIVIIFVIFSASVFKPPVLSCRTPESFPIAPPERTRGKRSVLSFCQKRAMRGSEFCYIDIYLFLSGRCVSLHFEKRSPAV